MAKNILIVEDEEAIRAFIAVNLKRNDFNVIEASNGEDAIEFFKKEKVDLIVLDIMLPGMDGFRVCRSIRELDEEVAIIMLTAKTQDMDKIMGLEFGADDYMSKPFNPLELMARIKAIFRRIDKREQRRIIQIDNFILNLDKKTIYKNNNPLELTYREFNVVKVLMENENKVLSRNELLDKAWGEDFFGDVKTVDVHIRRIREKMEDNPSKPEFIQTVWGYGYVFKGKE